MTGSRDERRRREKERFGERRNWGEVGACVWGGG